MLDTDCDGSISANRIDITKINPDLLEVLTPLFCEMEELGQTLDEDEFCDALSRLYESVPLPEKNLILSMRDGAKKKREDSQDKATFKVILECNLSNYSHP
jgi:hypothetical protein